jgi:nucleoside-diphosphate-sugar epimerase
VEVVVADLNFTSWYKYTTVYSGLLGSIKRNFMKIIVTGAAGFLGRHLCRALHQAGHQLKLIDLKPNPDFETIIADVRDAQAMDQHIVEADVVFHLAALIEAGESVKNPQAFVDSNITGSLNVLEAMRKNNVKVMAFSSTAAVYGEPQMVPITEDSRTIPINPYGVTKLALEGLLSSYVAAHGMTGIALRYFNLYGPEEHHQPETHAIPRFIQQIHRGEEVTVWGSGEHQRDYIHVSDIVSAHLDALALASEQPGQYHYFNLSTEKPTKVIEVIKLIEEIMGKPANIKHFPERPGDPLVLYADATKARQILGWQAKVSIKEGLQETVAYFMNYWANHDQAPV